MQGNWTHGFHPFNCNDNVDITRLNKLKTKIKPNKKHDYYKTAIYVWTELDPKKRNIAKQNNLNFIELWNLDDAKTFINQLTSCVQYKIEEEIKD